MREINLGRVTAYADAVNAGYTGTREEFAVDLANAATYAAEAGDSAAEAKASEDAAALSASTAAQAAVEAAGSEDAVHADAVAAQAAKTDAIAAKDTAVSKAGEAANSASAAGLSAAAASASETAAGAYANTASSSATSAIGSASAAAESASAAEDSATEAASALGDVTAAKTEALAAIQTKGEETLESIPEDYTTLRNDVSSLKSEISANDDVLYNSTSIDPTLSNYQAYITASNVWGGSNTRRAGIISVSGVDKIRITAKSSTYTSIALLTTNDRVNGTSPDYASGWTNPVTIQAGKVETFVVPDNANYLYYTREFDGNDRLPQNIEYLKNVIAPMQENITENANSLQTLENALEIPTDVDPIGSDYIGFIIASNVWYTTSVNRRCGLITIPSSVNKIRVTAKTSTYTGVAMLTTNAHVNNTTPDYASGWSNVATIPAGETRTYNVPEDAMYLYYTKTFDGNDRLPEKIEFLVLFNANDSRQFDIPLGLHEMPRNETALNIVKRCRQLTDIKWTPAVNLPRYMLVYRGGAVPDTATPERYLSQFSAGKEYTGIPYGRVSNTMAEYGYNYATVAHYIPIETFISSVTNPDSKLSKTDVGSVANHSSVIYATVCSGLVCYALNVPEVATSAIENISGLVSIGKVNNNGTLLDDNRFLIGDILNLSGDHAAIITDIIRDNNGEISFIELTDASSSGLADKNYGNGLIGGLCRRKGWTREQLFAPKGWGNYTVLRYNGVVPYTPNPYVNVGDEFNMQRVEHFPCMPYEGNKFTYKTGYIPNNAVKILVSLNGYSYLKVFKNGTEISGSPFAVTSETASIDVSEISAGTYTAYLCNITSGDVVNMTYPCEWTITE